MASISNCIKMVKFNVVKRNILQVKYIHCVHKLRKKHCGICKASPKNMGKNNVGKVANETLFWQINFWLFHLALCFQRLINTTFNAAFIFRTRPIEWVLGPWSLGRYRLAF